MIPETASIFAFSAISASVLYLSVYIGIIFFILYVLFWGISKVIHSILMLVSA